MRQAVLMLKSMNLREVFGLVGIIHPMRVGQPG